MYKYANAWRQYYILDADSSNRIDTIVYFWHTL